MSVKLNKTAMIDEYINNNIEMLINSNKSLEELCEDFNKNNDKKVSFSSFYKSFKQISKDKGLTKQRTRKSKHLRMLNEVKKDNKNDNKQDTNKDNEKKGLKQVPPEVAKSLLPDSDEEEEETPMQKMLHSYKEDNIDKLRLCEQKRVYGVERHLNNYEAQLFEISKKFKYNNKYALIVDADKWFRVNNNLYAPVVCILSDSNIYTNEEYNEMFKTSHPKSHNNYTNVIKIPNQDYKYKFYVAIDDRITRRYKPLCKTSYIKNDDIKELIQYERYEDLPEEEWDNNKQQTNEEEQQTNEEEQSEEEQQTNEEEQTEHIVNVD